MCVFIVACILPLKINILHLRQIVTTLSLITIVVVLLVRFLKKIYQFETALQFLSIHVLYGNNHFIPFFLSARGVNKKKDYSFTYVHVKGKSKKSPAVFLWNSFTLLLPFIPIAPFSFPYDRSTTSSVINCELIFASKFYPYTNSGGFSYHTVVFTPEKHLRAFWQVTCCKCTLWNEGHNFYSLFEFKKFEYFLLFVWFVHPNFSNNWFWILICVLNLQFYFQIRFNNFDLFYEFELFD